MNRVNGFLGQWASELIASSSERGRALPDVSDVALSVYHGVGMTEKLRNASLLLFGILMALVVAEVISKVLYTKPWYQKLVDEQTQKGRERFPFKPNKFGLRDQDYSASKSSNVKRVLILGDSFTFGAGVAENSLVFPELLEKQLNAEFSSQGRKIEILNGGIPGSLTNRWLRLLLDVKDSFQPDVILIVFFLRDGTRTGSIGGFFKPIRHEIKSKNENFLLYRYSNVFRLFQDYWDRQGLADKYSRKINESYLGKPGQTREWENAKTNLLKITIIGKEINAKVALVVFPILVELNDRYPFKRVCEVIINFGGENGIPTHDLLPAFMGNDGPDLWVSLYNQHPNARGHAIAAASILPFLRQLLMD